MPKDTVVYPILPGQTGYRSSYRRYARQEKEIVDSSKPQYSRGWLASRTPTQYLTVASRTSTRKISFQSSARELVATNNLGVRILELIAQDHDGNIYQGGPIEPNDTLKLAPATKSEVQIKLRKILNENLEEMPPGYTDRGYSYGYSISNGLLETHLQAIAHPLLENWGNGSYVAITEHGPEVVFGLEDVTESSSFHVVRGVW